MIATVEIEGNLMGGRLAAAFGLALGFAPLSAEASSCLMPQPQLAALQTPAGVLEFHEATSVALVSVSKASGPPCLIVQMAHWLPRSSADGRPHLLFPHDYCRPSVRSERFNLTTIETLKGISPAVFPAILNGRYPVRALWMSRNRPDWRWSIFLPRDIADERHRDFAFLHAGRMSDLSIVEKIGVCGDDLAPNLNPHLDYIVFRAKDGAIVHWEPVLLDHRDALLDRLRHLKAGKGSERTAITPKDFFAGLSAVTVYEIKRCDEDPSLAPAGGGRFVEIDQLISAAQSTKVWPEASVATCRVGDQFLLMASSAGSRRWPEEREWPSLRVVRVTGGRIQSADILTQTAITGPPTFSVKQALEWASEPRPWQPWR